MRKTNPFTPAREQRGFTLIEVLVAALVLSIGLLGLAGLQAVSQKLSHAAYQRSQATALAYEIADAIRANARNAQAYDGTVATNCNTGLSRTDSGTVAENDLAEWANRLACVLPSSQGTITVANEAVTVEVDWSEERARGTDTAPAADSAEDERDHIEIMVQL